METHLYTKAEPYYKKSCFLHVALYRLCYKPKQVRQGPWLISRLIWVQQLCWERDVLCFISYCSIHLDSKGCKEVGGYTYRYFSIIKAVQAYMVPLICLSIFCLKENIAGKSSLIATSLKSEKKLQFASVSGLLEVMHLKMILSVQ